jgi:hypothetical protein
MYHCFSPFYYANPQLLFSLSDLFGTKLPQKIEKPVGKEERDLNKYFTRKDSKWSTDTQTSAWLHLSLRKCRVKPP